MKECKMHPSGFVWHGVDQHEADSLCKHTGVFDEIKRLVEDFLLGLDVEQPNERDEGLFVAV